MSSKPRLWVMPLITGGLMLVLTAFLWRMLVIREEHAIQEGAKVEASRLLSHIKTDLYDRSLSLERMARRWEIHGGTPQDEFIQDASRIDRDFGGYQAIEWVDQSLKIRWLVPELGNEKVKDIDVTFEKNRRDAVEKAKELKTPTLSSPLQLLQNDMLGMQFYVPLFIRGKFDGFIVGVIDINRWLQHLFNTSNALLQPEAYVFVVSIDNAVVYQQATRIKPVKRLGANESASIFDHTLNVEVWPTQYLLTVYQRQLSDYVIYIGCLISFLIAMIFYMYKKSKFSEMNTLIMSHKLKKITDTLGMAANAGKVGIWTWDKQSNSIHWNQIMFDIYGVSNHVKPRFETWKQLLHPDDSEKTIKLLKSVVNGHGIYETQFRIILANGDIRYIKAATTIAKDYRGTTETVMGTNIDITNQVLAERMLQDEKQTLNKILEGTDVGTWVWDINKNQKTYNEKWAKILGYSLDEMHALTNDPWLYFSHPSDRKHAMKLLDKHFHHETPLYDCEVRMKHKNGQWIWIQDRGKVTTWSPDGKPTTFNKSQDKIHLRKKSEEGCL